MDKPPLLLIHGMWSRPRVWDALRERLEASGHATHAPALPHHDVDPAAAPAPELTTAGIDDYADVLVAEAQKLPAPVIVGHSMGGLLAQLVAARVRPRGLVLLSPGPTAAANVPTLSALRTLSRIVATPYWWRKPTRLDAGHARWGILNEVSAEVAEREIAAMVWDSGRALFQMALPWLDSTKATRVDYSTLTMPSLVMVGDRDRITPPVVSRITARRLRGRVDFRDIAGAGHWLFHEPVVDRVFSEVERFLGTLRP